MADLVPALLLSVLTGSVAGLLAGLLGVGGGMVIVPALVWIFGSLHFPPDSLMQFALATSLASILFTGASSVVAHHRRGAVRWDLVWRLAPALAFGTLAGSHFADRLGSERLFLIFGLFALVMGLRMLWRSAASLRGDGLPEKKLPVSAHAAVGALIGVASAFFGIGGGSLTVPYLSALRVRMQETVATSSACGMPIAVGGALGYVIAGWDKTGLPAGALGYVHLPSLAAIVAASVPMARLGVRLAHRSPARRLNQLFAVILLLVAADFLLFRGS